MKNLLRFERFYILFLLFSCTSIITKSQNWNLFPSTDTAYYYNYQPTGNPLKLTTLEPDLFHGKGTLQVIWIDSLLSVNGGDSVFAFQPVTTPPIFNQCIDTAGPTIFGKQFIKTNNNSYYVFNTFGDSMLIKPSASLYESWTF